MLPNLRDLRLFENRLSGELPVELWSLPKLSYLFIQNNGFNGALPTKIPENIQWLDLGSNKFSGSLPTSATGLQVFRAENNLLSGELPADMSKFANLTRLVLRGNQLTGSIP